MDMDSSSLSLEDINLWPKDRLKEYLRCRGLPLSGTVHELRALAYASQVTQVPCVPTKQEVCEMFVYMYMFY